MSQRFWLVGLRAAGFAVWDYSASFAESAEATSRGSVVGLQSKDESEVDSRTDAFVVLPSLIF